MWDIRKDKIGLMIFGTRVVSMMDKIKKISLKFSGHVKSIIHDAPIRRCQRLVVASIKRGRVSPKKYSRKVIR